MPIAENINHFNKILSESNTQLIAVSKTKPEGDLLQAYAAGQRHFGENKVQELTGKFEALPKDIKWHMIGHLQRNKVKYIAPFVSLIHAVDSPRLLKEINKQALKNNRVIDCLLQVHIAQEDTKFGFDEKELVDFLNSAELNELKNIKIIGLMGMATNTNDKEQVAQEFNTLKSLFDKIASEYSLAILSNREFNTLKSLFDKIASEYSLEQVSMKELSMGMTSDFEIACKSGSTMVRIGSAIFGSRNYPQQ